MHYPQVFDVIVTPLVATYFCKYDMIYVSIYFILIAFIPG